MGSGSSTQEIQFHETNKRFFNKKTEFLLNLSFKKTRKRVYLHQGIGKGPEKKGQVFIGTPIKQGSSCEITNPIQKQC